MKRIFFFLVALQFISTEIFSQVTVTVDAVSAPQPISKYLYGRNNSLSGDPGSSFTPEWTRLKDAGVRFFRESGGNNCTKYNWRLKISSHPDWYNNVYANDWSYAAQSLQQNIPGAQGMWAFQLIGKAAMTDAANFGDWTWNGSQWWQGVNQNLAGGGTPNPALWSQVTNPGNAPTKTNQPGNPDLYLENWTADSTTLILNHWFNDLSLNKSKLQYWNMDNEVEIWNGTHDDVMPVQITAEQFMQRYFEVAKKARERYPEIKLVGPVTANEWQWYNWATPITSGGKTYPWLEYFIKRIGEEQAAHPEVRLLDVLDIHFYPGSTDLSQVVQYHRVFFDKNYVFPEANGVKNVNGSWDNSQTKEYIFERCKAWLEKYIGVDHGVKFGLTETGVAITDPNAVAVWYASTLGEFTKHPEMEIFSPWSWSVGMWETLHLFSRYNKPLSIGAVSSEEEFVSAYPSINATADSITVMLVNRSTNLSKTVNLNFNGFVLADEGFNTLTIKNLPSTETFVSHQNNALKKASVNKAGNIINMSLAPLSVTAIQLKGQKGETVTGINSKEIDNRLIEVFPNPVSAKDKLTVRVNQPGKVVIELRDVTGRVMHHIFNGEIKSIPFTKEIDVSNLSKGVYFIQMNLNGKIASRKVMTN